MDAQPSVLFYPFHLCHPTTLQSLLARYTVVHFRDYMALQLTAFFGTTASQERMGAEYPELVQTGRIVQGYSVSGPLAAETTAAIDRDLADPTWRRLFHAAFQQDRRFQRGLFDPAHAMQIGRSIVPGPAAILRLMEESWSGRSFTVARVCQMTRELNTCETGYECEYGLGLVKTSAALVYTIQLAHTHDLQAVTDSAPHFALLQRTLTREGLRLLHTLLPRQNY